MRYREARTIALVSVLIAMLVVFAAAYKAKTPADHRVEDQIEGCELAKRDIDRGRLVNLILGDCKECAHQGRAAEILDERYSIVTLGYDQLTSEPLAHDAATAYKEAMESEFDERFGLDVIGRTYREAARIYELELTLARRPANPSRSTSRRSEPKMKTTGRDRWQERE